MLAIKKTGVCCRTGKLNGISEKPLDFFCCSHYLKRADEDKDLSQSLQQTALLGPASAYSPPEIQPIHDFLMAIDYALYQQCIKVCLSRVGSGRAKTRLPISRFYDSIPQRKNRHHFDARKKGSTSLFLNSI